MGNCQYKYSRLHHDKAPETLDFIGFIIFSMHKYTKIMHIL